MPWVDQHTGKPYRITTVGFHGDRRTARVKTYGDILHEYEFHPGSKSADGISRIAGLPRLLCVAQAVEQGEHVFIVAAGPSRQSV
jgi:hypothetical protein